MLVFALIIGACARHGSAPVSLVPAGPDTLDLIVAGTTDVHGWLRGWDYFANAPDSTRGLSRIATIVDSLRSASPDRVVLVDAGDDLQGTPLTSVALRDSTRSNPIVAAMNVMRYDAGVIGNHEFNSGSRTSTAPSRRRRFRWSRQTCSFPTVGTRTSRGSCGRRQMAQCA
jgi:2',3'-cyclic-nucleotide 2'-phosphodiesterase (5'-nucleotidase family)